MKLSRLFLLALAPHFLGAAALKIDFSVGDRPDSFSPGHEQWLIQPGQSTSTKSFGGADGRSARTPATASAPRATLTSPVTFTLRAIAPQGGNLAAAWWKGGAQPPNRMAVDGIIVTGATAGPQLELRIGGLTPGRHTLATFHNISERTAELAQRIDISVDGATRVTGITPSRGAAHDDDAATAFLELDAQAGKDVVIVFSGDRQVILCGLELDGAMPARRAGVPVPADRDEHVDADTGKLELAWRAPGSASAYQVYFGRDRDRVDAATPDAAEFLGRTVAPRYELSGMTPHEDYFWRIDALDAQNRATKGDTWRFRARRLAFPGAEGYGRFARGGRSGRVIEVTNLNDSGPGSLRAAVEAEGPRTVVFAVGGLITLERGLVMRNPYLTVAGQTAPGKGITLRKYNFGMIGSHDVIVRHVRVRPGNISGATLDGMGMASADHTIYDHVSISWTIDESFSSRSARNITLQRALISEALNQAGHRNYPPGSQHGYAASISGHIGSFHHNLLAHNSGRNWSLAGGLNQANRHAGWLDLRNNIVYNWQNRTTDGGAAKVNYVNNYYKPGPASKVFHVLKPERNNIAGFGPQDYFVAGNVMEGHVTADNALGGVIQPDPRRAPRGSGDAVEDHDDAAPTRFVQYAEFIKGEPFFESHVTTQSAAAAYKVVLSDVGANRPVLDEHDARVIDETLTGTARFRGSKTGLPGIPDSQEDVGGWENYPAVSRPADWDTDHDGLPNWWEQLHKLNPSSAANDFSDANRITGDSGFTELERYLDWMAQPHVTCAAGGSVTIDLAALTRGYTASPKHTLGSMVGGAGVIQGDGRTARFTAAAQFHGLGHLTFTVTDAAGDTLTRTIGIHVP